MPITPNGARRKPPPNTMTCAETGTQPLGTGTANIRQGSVARYDACRMTFAVGASHAITIRTRLTAGIGSLYQLKQLGTGLLLILLTLFNAVMGLQQEGKAAAAVAALQKMVII